MPDRKSTPISPDDSKRTGEVTQCTRSQTAQGLELSKDRVPVEPASMLSPELKAALPTSEELSCSDDTPVDNEQNKSDKPA
ncbi:MAG: hypothetical protein KME35_00130 [Aphanocapsa sp. GSE-SYN-MK-11-07L]|nr:hypothetical protein [Aphanocapsa sp. GSE-SYN-MK-11-07L]